MNINRRAAMAALMAVPMGGALAQPSGGYPAKPIKLVVPFPPGGGGDTLGRLTSARIGRELGQPFVIENVAGAGGNIGAMAVARSPADGYALLYGTNGTHGINQTLYRSPGFDPGKDFEPIGRMTRIAAILVVRQGLNVQSAGELVRLMRANPGKLTFGSAGNGTTSHLAGEMLKSQANLFAVHVPYRGGGPAMNDLLAGRIDFMIDVAPSVASHLQGGRIRALAVSTAQRSAAFADLPTIAEAAVPGFDISAWDALFAPAGTPRALVDTVNAAMRRALADPELRRTLLSRATEPWASSPEELGAFVRTEIDRWGAAVKRAGAQVE